MNMPTRAVYWEAPEHHHIEKKADWYWIVGIIAGASTIASIIFGNTLFAIVIILSVLLVFHHAQKVPRFIPFEISDRGVRIDTNFYPYTSFSSFYIDEKNVRGPHIIFKQKNYPHQFILMPTIPESHIHDIEHILTSRLPEEYLKEPFSQILLEYLGF